MSIPKRLLVCLACACSLAMTPEAWSATLFQAAAAGDLQAVRNYVDKAGLDVDLADTKGNTALIYASQSGNTAVIEYLLQHKANPNKRGQGQLLAVHYAISYGNYTNVALLLAAGTDPIAKTVVPDVDAKTPTTLLDYAFTRMLQDKSLQHAAVYRVLTDGLRKRQLPVALSKVPKILAAAKQNALLASVARGTVQEIAAAIKAGADPTEGDTGKVDSFSPVRFAVVLDRVDVFQYFVTAGFVEDPFKLACLTAFQVGYGFSAAQSVRAGANLNDVLDSKIQSGTLREQIGLGRGEWRSLLEFLVGSGYDPLTKDQRGGDLVAFTIWWQYKLADEDFQGFEVLKFLLDKGYIDVNTARVKNGDTILVYAMRQAISENHPRTLTLIRLLSNYAGFDVNTTNAGGFSALTVARRLDDGDEVVNLLRSLGAKEIGSLEDFRWSEWSDK